MQDPEATAQTPTKRRGVGCTDGDWRSFNTRQLRYETDLQNVGRGSRDSLPCACHRELRQTQVPQQEGKGEERVSPHTEGRLLRDTTDEGWGEPLGTHAAAQGKGNPSPCLKSRHRSPGARSAPAKEPPVAPKVGSQGLQHPGFEEHGKAPSILAAAPREDPGMVPPPPGGQEAAPAPRVRLRLR